MTTKTDELLPHIGKKVKIFLRNNRIYTGIIHKVSNSAIVMQDKYGDEVIITPESISEIISSGGSCGR